MVKETINMIMIMIVYRKQVIKVGASDLHICTALSCISYPHIHQSQQPFSVLVYFHGILVFVLKHIISEREGYRKSGLV
jgi:hypothetical protein